MINFDIYIIFPISAQNPFFSLINKHSIAKYSPDVDGLPIFLDPLYQGQPVRQGGILTFLISTSHWSVWQEIKSCSIEMSVQFDLKETRTRVLFTLRKEWRHTPLQQACQARKILFKFFCICILNDPRLWEDASKPQRLHQFTKRSKYRNPCIVFI